MSATGRKQPPTQRALRDRQLPSSLKDRIVTALMLISLAFMMIPDDMPITSPEYDEIQGIRDWRMWVGPGYVFLVATVVVFFGTLAGGFARLFGLRWSRLVLVVAAVGTLLGTRGYDTYTDTYLMAGAEAIWIFLMGWLVATPVSPVDKDYRAKVRNASVGIAVAVIAVFSLHGWFIFGSRDAASYAADVSLDIESGGETVEGAGEFQMRVGKFSTVRMDGYIVDLIVQDASAEEANVELHVFEELNGGRGRKLTSCVDFTVPVGQGFGAAVSCGDLLIGLSGKFDSIE
jgi:hypothetical protein